MASVQVRPDAGWCGLSHVTAAARLFLDGANLLERSTASGQLTTKELSISTPARESSPKPANMTRGNQREKAREKNMKKLDAEVSPAPCRLYHPTSR